jgi:hypothetical protein
MPHPPPPPNPGIPHKNEDTIKRRENKPNKTLSCICEKYRIEGSLKYLSFLTKRFSPLKRQCHDMFVCDFFLSNNFSGSGPGKNFAFCKICVTITNSAVYSTPGNRFEIPSSREIYSLTDHKSQ